MAKLGEGINNAAGAAADSVGVSGAKFGWDMVRKAEPKLWAVPLAAGAAALGDVETFVFPNSVRDYIIEDNVSTYSEYLKSGASITASAVLDGLSLAGAVGVGVLTKSFEAAMIAKIALNAATSFAVRTADSVQRRRRATT